MPVPYTLEELRAATHELIAANGLRECYIRPIVFRGYGQMGLYPLDCAVRVSIAVLALGRLPGRGGQAQRRARQGLELAPDLRRLADPARQGQAASTSTACWRRSRPRRPATRRRSCSTRTASSARAPARTSTWSATARSSRRPRRQHPRRDQPPLDHARSPATSATRSIERDIARAELYARRRGVLVGHGGRARAGARDRRPQDRRRRARRRSRASSRRIRRRPARARPRYASGWTWSRPALQRRVARTSVGASARPRTRGLAVDPRRA